MRKNHRNNEEREQRLQYFDQLEHLAAELETLLMHLSNGTRRKAKKAAETVLQRLDRYIKGNMGCH